MNLNFRKNSLIFIELILISILALALEQIIATISGGIEWMPSLLLLVVIFSGLSLGGFWGAFVGFFNGLFYSSITLSNIGLQTFCWCLIGLLAGRIKARFFLDSTISKMFFLFILLVIERLFSKILV